jgi:hypothetical protein
MGRRHARHHGDRQRHRRRLSDGRVSRDGRSREGMTAGTHGSTFGGNPLAMAVGNAVLDVVLAPGFLEHVEHRQLFPPAACGLIAEHPDVFEELRGEGLMLGLKMKVPNTDFIARCARTACWRRRGRQCGAPVAAAHHRRRACARGDAAAVGNRGGFRGERQENGGGMNAPVKPSKGPKHFIDLADLDSAHAATR